MKILALAILLSFAAIPAPAQVWLPPQAAPAPVKELIQQWFVDNDECRGGTDEHQTAIACRLRDHVQSRIQAAGWCYGEHATSGADADWAVCRAHHG